MMNGGRSKPGQVCYTIGMTTPREISQRELRNDVSRILRLVEAGETLFVTVSGRPVAELRPIRRERYFMPRSALEQIIRDAPLDANFRRDVDAALDQTIDEW